MTLLVSALSGRRAPECQVSSITIRNAGRLNQAPVNWPPAIIGLGELRGQMEAEDAVEQVVADRREKPTATAMLETAYSRIRSQPMIQAKISPSVA